MAQQNSQQTRLASLGKLDPVWAKVREEAEDIVRREPELATFLYSTILHHDSLEEAVIHRVAARLDHEDVSADMIRQAYADAIE
ncbi:MAG: serine O-acetyltransferase, partial [Pseudorhodoplanes sp.]